MNEHIAASYDNELNDLAAQCTRLGGLAEAQVADCLSAVVKRDQSLAINVVSRDERLDDVGDARRFELRLQLNRRPDHIQTAAFEKRWERGDAWTTRVPIRFEGDHLVIGNTDLEELVKLKQAKKEAVELPPAEGRFP